MKILLYLIVYGNYVKKLFLKKSFKNFLRNQYLKILFQ